MCYFIFKILVEKSINSYFSKCINRKSIYFLYFLVLWKYIKYRNNYFNMWRFILFRERNFPFWHIISQIIYKCIKSRINMSIYIRNLQKPGSHTENAEKASSFLWSRGKSNLSILSLTCVTFFFGFWIAPSSLKSLIWKSIWKCKKLDLAWWCARQIPCQALYYLSGPNISHFDILHSFGSYSIYHR